MHLETIGYSATAPGATGTAAAALAGDSLTIKNSVLGKRALIVAHVADKQLLGWEQVAFPSGHDSTRGYRVSAAASEVNNLLPRGLAHRVNPQETLSITMVGSITAGDVETGLLWVWYEDMPGINARLLTAAECLSRVEKLTTVYCSITTTAGPGWTGGEAITSESDLLLANRDYALLGATCSIETAGIGVRSADWGGVRVAIPGNELRPDITGRWFLDLALSLDLPMIPVLNSGNKGNILIDCAQDENAAAVTLSLILGLLPQGG